MIIHKFENEEIFEALYKGGQDDFIKGVGSQTTAPGYVQCHFVIDKYITDKEEYWGDWISCFEWNSETGMNYRTFQELSSIEKHECWFYSNTELVVGKTNEKIYSKGTD
jgi:hypothetical protein